MATDKLKQIKSVCNIARSELKKRPFDSKRDQARTLAFVSDIERILAQMDRRVMKKYYGYQIGCMVVSNFLRVSKNN